MKRLWKVGLGRMGEYEADARSNDILTVGFCVKSDIAHAKNRSALLGVMEEIFPGENPKKHLNFAAQLNQFINVIQIGDLVVSPFKSSATIAVGRVTGPYQPHPLSGSPTRPVEWIRPDLPRSAFKQDLLYSFGAFMTVCEIARNDALKRVEKVVKVGIDPGDGVSPMNVKTKVAPIPTDAEVVAQEVSDELADLEQIARDQIERRLASVFTGHDLTRLVAAILEAQGKGVRVSPPGADAGLDIVAGSGPLGLESPRIVVQVKSGNEVVDHPTLQSLIGTLHDTKADFGLLVSWAGFTAPVYRRLNELYFQVRLWGRKEIIDNLFTVYDDLPEAIRAELPMRRTWTLVPDESTQG